VETDGKSLGVEKGVLGRKEKEKTIFYKNQKN